jgi:hypothetical protein
MLPAHDHMPEGGLGNLIALSLQGQSLKKSNSTFIDIENVKPRMQNQIRTLDAFSNPEFYKIQAMGFTIYWQTL